MNSETTVKRIDELLRFLPIFETPGKELYVWKGGEISGNTISCAYPEYDEAVESFMKLAGKACWTDKEYTNEPVEVWIQDDRFIALATMVQMKTLLTWCVRVERFCDGHWTHMLDEGRVVALLNRLQELRRDYL